MNVILQCLPIAELFSAFAESFGQDLYLYKMSLCHVKLLFTFRRVPFVCHLWNCQIKRLVVNYRTLVQLLMNVWTVSISQLIPNCSLWTLCTLQTSFNVVKLVILRRNVVDL